MKEAVLKCALAKKALQLLISSDFVLMITLNSWSCCDVIQLELLS